MLKTMFRLSLALTGLLLFAVPVDANETVILRTGRRMEVERAHLTGDTCHIKLVGGGDITVPVALIKRISTSAADLPAAREPVIASTTGGAGAASLSAGAVAAGLPPGAERDSPFTMKEHAASVRMPRLDASQLAGSATGQPQPAPLPGGAMAGPMRQAVAGQPDGTGPAPSMLTNPLRPGSFQRTGGAGVPDRGRQRGGTDAGLSGGLPRVTR